MLWNTLLLALREIRRNVTRSSLTILGVVIGVAAVIIMVTLGGGASAQITREIASLGENLLIITPGTRQQSLGRSSDTEASMHRSFGEQDDVFGDHDGALVGPGQQLPATLEARALVKGA